LIHQPGIARTVKHNPKVVARAAGADGAADVEAAFRRDRKSGAEAKLDLAAVTIYAGVMTNAREGVASTRLPKKMTRLQHLRAVPAMLAEAIMFAQQVISTPARLELCMLREHRRS